MVLIEQCRNPRKSWEREATNGSTCKCGCLGKCSGVQCLNGPTRLLQDYLNIIIFTLRAIISGYLVNP